MAVYKDIVIYNVIIKVWIINVTLKTQPKQKSWKISISLKYTGAGLY